ncbi:hypothetical protein IQ235_11890 [Oscillatoriales cyanobacterium LEGE 11467]|uniref:Uncharacterized protein n=1 Tax=Zarconia navalis LEGE 11467 TaxID=1828826 RepID=A0A928Z999_9CYAN|nr:hypothetical protein [Zarconia navalis]MBE9041483.1 hypothetical protein [Zarconia navalis LEGE 11467]
MKLQLNPFEVRFPDGSGVLGRDVFKKSDSLDRCGTWRSKLTAHNASTIARSGGWAMHPHKRSITDSRSRVA